MYCTNIVNVLYQQSRYPVQHVVHPAMFSGGTKSADPFRDLIMQIHLQLHFYMHIGYLDPDGKEGDLQIAFWTYGIGI